MGSVRVGLCEYIRLRSAIAASSLASAATTSFAEAGAALAATQPLASSLALTRDGIGGVVPGGSRRCGCGLFADPALSAAPGTIS